MVSVSKFISPVIKFVQTVIYFFHIIPTFHFMLTAACLPRSVTTASNHCTIMLKNASICTKINNGYHKHLHLMPNTIHRVTSQHHLHKNVSRFNSFMAYKTLPLLILFLLTKITQILCSNIVSQTFIPRLYRFTYMWEFTCVDTWLA